MSTPTGERPLRVCIVYDCLFPWTVGGAERWYRHLSAELVAAGVEVTYLTRRQWSTEAGPEVPGVRVVAVSPGGELYGAAGGRRVGPPLRFALGVFSHLLRRRSAYDVVHTCGFPYFPVLAIRAALLGRHQVRVVVEWVEVWSESYWRDYLGRLGGQIGHAVQRLCIRLTPMAFAHSVLHADRLRAEGYRGPEPLIIGGLYRAPETEVEQPQAAYDEPPTVLFAGRHIADKRAHLVPPAVQLARQEVPGLRAVVLGDGPERQRVQEAVTAAGLVGVVDLPGFVSGPAVARVMRGAVCLLLPSAREGHGLVVVESCAVGTPVVVVAGPDNAATELVTDGVNGVVAGDAEPATIAAALVHVVEAGEGLRASTRQWYAANATRLSVTTSAARVLTAYRTAGS